ncbi:C39 family peptidase [Bacillus swezeyi]|nr:C39 family peptidase [Bacillus swezeyi]
MRKLLSFIIISCIVLSTFLIDNSGAEAASVKKINQKMKISVNYGNVRKGPGTNYKILATLKRNSSLQAYQKKSRGRTVWYHVKYKGKKTGWVSSTIVKSVKVKSNSSKKKTKSEKSKSVKLNAPLYNQNPQLPNGCEVTSLSMMLNYAGKKVNKMTLAKKIKKVPPRQNPNVGFVGDMYHHGRGGLGVYHKPVADLAKKYLGKRVVDLSGKSFDNAVIKQLNKKKPVWVISNVTFKKLPSSAFQTWYTKTGKVKVTTKMHAVLVTGYDKNYVYFNDPLIVVKNRKIKKSNFKAAWEQMGRQAISYK